MFKTLTAKVLSAAWVANLLAVIVTLQKCQKVSEGDTGVYGMELFFKRYVGNFDFNVRYCGII